MACRLIYPGAIAAVLLLGAGCATTVREPPPTVAPQPPSIMAEQAITEGKIAAEKDDEQTAVADAASKEATAPAPASSPAPVPAEKIVVQDPSAPGRAQRYQPTARSTQQIREQNAAASLPLDFGQRLDHAHDRLYTMEQTMVEATDRYFAAKDRPLQPVPAAPFRIGTSVELLDRNAGVKPHLNVDLDIALHMVNIEQRLRVFVTSDELDGGRRRDNEDSQLRAGLRYELLRDFDFDVGVRIKLPPYAFASVKWSREYQFGEWDFYPLLRGFLETRESVGYEMGATFDRWSGRQLLRSSSYAKWRHDRNATEWSQTFIYARASELLVPDRYGSYISADDIGHGWGLRLEASGDDTNQVTQYETGVFFHGGTSHHWLYWFVEPLVQWNRNYNWSADPGIRIGIDALFWDLARPGR